MKLRLIAPIAVTILASSASAATLIAGSGITVTVNESPGFFPQNVVNGTGLNVGTGVHSASGEWYTGNSAPRADSFISFDLGTTVVLDSIHVWNATQFVAFGIQTLDIYVSAVATPGDPEGVGAANWNKIGTNVTFTQGAVGNLGFDLETQTLITLPGSAVRHIRFESNSTFQGTGGGYVGLAEVQFFSIPEPSAALLGGLGLLALLRRRRN